MIPTTDFLKFYPGYDGYKKLTEKDLSNLEGVEKSEIPGILIKLIDFYEQGLPYSLRPVFLDAFYSLLITDGYDVRPGAMEKIHNFFLETIANPDYKDYLFFLNENKLFENAQFRGDIYAENIDLSLIILDKKVNLPWAETVEMAENFLKNEPAISIPFYEKYFTAFANTYQKENTHLSTIKLFDLAETILKYSIDSTFIKYAWTIKHDDVFMRNFYKETFAGNDLQDLNKLERLEDDLVKEFGEIESHNHFSSKGGRMLVNVLSREKKEERREQKLFQQQTIANISIEVKSKENYCKGYKEYLSAIVYFGTDDLKKGISSLEAASAYGFDPDSILEMLLSLYSDTKKIDKAADLAQELITICGILNIEEAQSDQFNDDYLKAIEKANRQPAFFDQQIAKIIVENKININQHINDLSKEIKPRQDEIVKARIDKGIQLLDSLIDNQIIDKAIHENQILEQLTVEANIQDLQHQSLEELKPFIEAGSKDLVQLYEGTITLKRLIEYVNNVRLIVQSEKDENIDFLIRTFPNLCASAVIGNELSMEAVHNGDSNGGIKLLNHIFEKRDEKRNLGFLEPIKLLVAKLNSDNRFNESIVLLKKGSKIMGDEESSAASDLLKETYLMFIESEKSPVKRNKILLEAEEQDLHQNDDRFTKYRKEINNQLNKRKKTILIASGIALVVVVVVILIFTL